MVKWVDLLEQRFKEIEPKEFYRTIFPVGELDTKDSFTKGKYVGIACEFCKTKKDNGQALVKRYSITDDLDVIDELLESENFIIVSPIAYRGKSRKTDNAMVLYAVAVEIDNLLVRNGKPVGFNDLIFQMDKGFLPKANYIVASGNGLHLYFVLDRPLILYPNVKKSLKNFKKSLTRKFWNAYITSTFEENEVQYESAFQGFRLVGGVTKKGDRTRVFSCFDDIITVDYLNSFMEDDCKIQVDYKSKYTLKEAQEKFPKWFDNRIVNNKPKGSWCCNRALYDWWFRRIQTKEVIVGHRYYCVLMLCIYAIKCNIEREELERDCLSLIDFYESKTESEDNHFTEKDVADALQAYEDKSLVTFPINSIIQRSGLLIEKNKRNGRKQELHLKIARAIRDISQFENGIQHWSENSPHNGRSKGSGTKQELVKEWRSKNPTGRKIDCHRALGLSRVTIDKWW